MINRKCSSCGEKVGKKFSYCPYCGHSFRRESEERDFGMLGRDDYVSQENRKEIRLPFGFNKIINLLVKQIDKEMEDMVRKMQTNNARQTNPNQFKIRISSGPGNSTNKNTPKKEEGIKGTKQVEITKEEIDRRKKLKREEANSNVRRLSDRIVYEIHMPGVNKEKDIIITKLEDSVEVRGYSRNKCFYKTIPLKEDLLDYHISKGKLFVELKN